MALTLHIHWNKSEDVHIYWTRSLWMVKTAFCTSFSPCDLAHYSILDTSVRQALRNIHSTEKNISEFTLPF